MLWPIWKIKLSVYSSLAFLMVIGCTEHTNTNKFSLKNFSRICIMDGGRVKPLDSYARTKMLQFSGRNSCNNQSPVNWLARVIFTPDIAVNDKIFLLDNPEIADAIGVTPQKKRRYSYTQLMTGFNKLCDIVQKAKNNKSNEFSSFENEAIRLLSNLDEYSQMLSVFEFFLPDQRLKIVDSSVCNYLGFAQGTQNLSYFDLLSKSYSLTKITDKIDKREWTGFDSSIMELSGSLYRITEDYSSRVFYLFYIIPDDNGNEIVWNNPWHHIVSRGFAACNDSALMALLQIRNAYISGNQAWFDDVSSKWSEIIQKKAGCSNANITLEILYNKLSPFSKSRILYGICIICTLISIYWQARWLRNALMLLLIAVLTFHTTGIIFRIVIMMRPPVTNLYETFVFVAWSCVLLGLVMELFHKKSIGLFIASLTGFLLLHISNKYALDGDTLGMLTAVLNSNFWLTTHIITIALGYAGCCVAGVMGHVYLIQYCSRCNKMQLISIERLQYGLLLFGLIFTFIGTMFGGMWADQAWGRFWGWDPKENGALIIILWNTAILHAISGKIINGPGTAIALIVGLILVMFAWIGVNLLGVGLHSYGFTSSGALTLFGFTFAEVIFLIIIGIIIYKKNKTPDASKISS